MKTASKYQLYFFVMASFLISLAHAFPGESISLDPVSGNYTIIYWNESMEPPALETTTFVPSTNITTTLHSSLHMERDAKIFYRYTLINAKQSRQYVGHMILDPISEIAGVRDDRYVMIDETDASWAALRALSISNKAALSTPSGWRGSVSFGAMGRKENTVRVGWSNSSGLQPGGIMQGFGFASTALPGVIMAELKGRAPVHGWSGEGPTENSAIYEQLNSIRDNNFVPRPAAVPAIAVSNSINSASLLESIQTQMHTWIGMQLLDTTFFSQLDRYLTAAADAYRHNQPKVVKEYIEKVREMLKREHQDMDQDDDKEDVKSADNTKHIMIDRLAARVLDFDLQYVLKRMDKDHD